MSRSVLPVVSMLLFVSLPFASCAYTCYSESLFHQKLEETKKLALNSAMTAKEVECLMEKGRQFPPDELGPREGAKATCYVDTKLRHYMVSSMEECVGKEELMSHRRVTALRKPIKPDGPVRAVAHWLGLQETVREECHCWSGCHYCCIQTALGGNDFCFELYCLAVGRCD
eukprot:GFKZ01011051.1.p1 GENE.GFKZ01011051.1~~GFKZ01011051.1.p1  ORF type:complete len:171 (-),score=10.93 GFKZ01011051.1:804-1316(-)